MRNLNPTSFDERLKKDANDFGISVDEYIRIIDSGEVYNGGTFSVYYNYKEGMIYTSGIRKGL